MSFVPNVYWSSIVKALVLGDGQAAKSIERYAKEVIPQVKVVKTSRTNKSCIEFDLLNIETWSNLPQADIMFWTFPARPLPVVKDFLDECKNRFTKLVVIGSTGSFVTKQKHGWVTEQGCVDKSLPRVAGELEILNNGGTIVYASGIYSQDKNPIRWLQQDRIKNMDRYVNLIHVDDLAQFLWKAAMKDERGKIYIASDGKPFLWKDLYMQWKDDFNLPELTLSFEGIKPSKRVDSSKSLQELEVVLKYTDIVTALKKMRLARPF